MDRFPGVQTCSCQQIVSMMPEPPPSVALLFSLTARTPAGGTSSASPSEQSAPGRVVELMPVSDRLPLESSNAAVSRKTPTSEHEPHVQFLYASPWRQQTA